MFLNLWSLQDQLTPHILESLHPFIYSQEFTFYFSNVPCLHLLAVSWKMLVAQSCLTLCDPMDYNLPGFSIHGILQARILEWVAIPFSRGSFWPKDQTWSPTLQADSLPLSHQRSPNHSHSTAQLSLLNNHNHLFDKFPCLILKCYPNWIIFLNMDLIMLFSWKPLPLPQHMTTLPPPLSNSSVRFSKASKVCSSPNIYPTPTPYHTSPHTDYGLTTPIYSQVHSESFYLCLCLTYPLVLEGPSSHYQSSTQILQL